MRFSRLLKIIPAQMRRYKADNRQSNPLPAGEVPYLIRYPEDGRLGLSNDRAEHSIKPFAMGRGN